MTGVLITYVVRITFVDSRCHMLKNTDCDVSLYKILDYEEAGWFYHAPFRSCRPFYAANRERCQQNRDLPLTKEECEEICGKLFRRFSLENLMIIKWSRTASEGVDHKSFYFISFHDKNKYIHLSLCNIFST